MLLVAFVWLHYCLFGCIIVCLIALVVIRLFEGTCLLTFGCWFVCFLVCVFELLFVCLVGSFVCIGVFGWSAFVWLVAFVWLYYVVFVCFHLAVW